MKRKCAINTAVKNYADAVARMNAWRETLVAGAALDPAGGFSVADVDYLLGHLQDMVMIPYVEDWALSPAEVDKACGASAGA